MRRVILESPYAGDVAWDPWDDTYWVDHLCRLCGSWWQEQS